MAVLLEYAQHHNGRFAGWIEGGIFPDRATAEREAAARGLLGEGDEFLISDATAWRNANRVADDHDREVLQLEGDAYRNTFAKRCPPADKD